MQRNNKNTLIFTIGVEDLQNESFSRLGRRLEDKEIEIATKGLESGLLFDIDSVYGAIFEEIKEEYKQ